MPRGSSRRTTEHESYTARRTSPPATDAPPPPPRRGSPFCGAPIDAVLDLNSCTAAHATARWYSPRLPAPPQRSRCAAVRACAQCGMLRTRRRTVPAGPPAMACHCRTMAPTAANVVDGGFARFRASHSPRDASSVALWEAPALSSRSTKSDTSAAIAWRCTLRSFLKTTRNFALALTARNRHTVSRARESPIPPKTPPPRSPSAQHDAVAAVAGSVCRSARCTVGAGCGGRVPAPFEGSGASGGGGSNWVITSGAGSGANTTSSMGAGAAAAAEAGGASRVSVPPTRFGCRVPRCWCVGRGEAIVESYPPRSRPDVGETARAGGLTNANASVRATTNATAMHVARLGRLRHVSESSVAGGRCGITDRCCRPRAPTMLTEHIYPYKVTTMMWAPWL